MINYSSTGVLNLLYGCPGSGGSAGHQRSSLQSSAGEETSATDASDQSRPSERRADGGGNLRGLAVQRLHRWVYLVFIYDKKTFSSLKHSEKATLTDLFFWS